MQWKNAKHDGLPSTSRTVVICVSGIYHIAQFDSINRVFLVQDNAGLTSFPGSDSTVYWSQLPDDVMKVPLRVLIAEDDEDDHEILRSSLLRVLPNPEVISVHDGEQAIDYLLRRKRFEKVEHTPDFVLLDLSLPRHDGFSVLRTVRGTPSLMRLPVYMVTTSSNTDDWSRAMSLGANGYYRKGASMIDLLRVVQEISKKHLGDE